MANNINIEELDKFNDFIDELIDDIESGSVKANPLKPKEVEPEEVIAKGSATEYGEDELEAMDLAQYPITPKEAYLEGSDLGSEMITVNGKDFSFCEDKEYIGRPGSVLVVVSNENGEVVFGSAAVAARETGFNPTTVRDRCKKEFVDSDGNTWQYKEL